MASLILIVVLLSLGGTLFASENIPHSAGSLKIINGQFTTIDQYPINVAFLVSNNIWGAGVIVDSKWILTTAFNCLWVDPSYITVRVASSYWTKDGLIIPAEKCIMHPNYAGSWSNDIAMLKLANYIKFGPNSRQGYYAPKASLNIVNATYDVSGWGVRSPSYAKETQLQTTKQTILAPSECNEHYNGTVGTFCAYNEAGGPCAFDFGAPLNLKRKLVGLYSGSIDCTQPAVYPALYTDVYQYKDWITTVMTEN